MKVILNGDFIDFPQVIQGIKTTPPNRFLGTTEAESTLRLQKVIAGHAAEFNALKHFLTVKGNELLLISGNHDIDFAWNRVLFTFMQRIGAIQRISNSEWLIKRQGCMSRMVTSIPMTIRLMSRLTSHLTA